MRKVSVAVGAFLAGLLIAGCGLTVAEAWSDNVNTSPDSHGSWSQKLPDGTYTQCVYAMHGSTGVTVDCDFDK